jgi:hypothetical protein
MFPFDPAKVTFGKEKYHPPKGGFPRKSPWEIPALIPQKGDQMGIKWV